MEDQCNFCQVYPTDSWHQVVKQFHSLYCKWTNWPTQVYWCIGIKSSWSIKQRWYSTEYAIMCTCATTSSKDEWVHLLSKEHEQASTDLTENTRTWNNESNSLSWLWWSGATGLQLIMSSYATYPLPMPDYPGRVCHHPCHQSWVSSAPFHGVCAQLQRSPLGLPTSKLAFMPHHGWWHSQNVSKNPHLFHTISEVCPFTPRIKIPV